MDKAPAFQFYANDYMRGTSTFTLAEKGGYVDLLCYQWDNWDGRGIPGEDLREIARIMRCDLAEARRVWPKIQRKFSLRTSGGLWQNERLEDVRQGLIEYREKQAAKGRASAEARAAKAASVVNRGSTAVGTVVQPRLEPRHQPRYQPETQPEGNRTPTGVSTGGQLSSLQSPDRIEPDTSKRSPSDGRTLWMRIIEELELSEKNRLEFFEPCEVYSYEPGRLVINARHGFIARWLNAHFWKRVREIGAAVEPGLHVDLVSKSVAVAVR